VFYLAYSQYIQFGFGLSSASLVVNCLLMFGSSALARRSIEFFSISALRFRDLFFFGSFFCFNS